MSKIKQLTQAIRNYAECELDYGTVRTLKMIDDEADRLETQLKNTSSNSDYTKCLQRFCDLLDDDDCFDWHGDISGFIEKYKKHFA